MFPEYTQGLPADTTSEKKVPLGLQFRIRFSMNHPDHRIGFVTLMMCGDDDHSIYFHPGPVKCGTTGAYR